MNEEKGNEGKKNALDWLDDFISEVQEKENEKLSESLWKMGEGYEESVRSFVKSAVKANSSIWLVLFFFRSAFCSTILKSSNMRGSDELSKSYLWNHYADIIGKVYKEEMENIKGELNESQSEGT